MNAWNQMKIRLLRVSALFALFCFGTCSNATAQTDSPPQVGTFFLQSYSYNGSLGVPFPFDPYYGMEPMVQLTNGAWLIQDSSEDYQALQDFRGVDRAGMMSMDEMDSGSGDGLDFPQWTPPTNSLWIEITNVANDTASLNLHYATNYVYEIWSKTNLSDPAWTIETEVFPYDSNCMPFTVLLLGRKNTLFFWARDWTSVDDNTNGLFDWWEWKYFGNFNQTASGDFDGNGIDNGTEYTNGVDPNKIQFLLQIPPGNLATNSTLESAINLLGGVPFYRAVLINDDNFLNAQWQPYTGTNFSVGLYNGDGPYRIWVGLRGLPSDGFQTWQKMDIQLDTVTPVLTVTNPVLTAGAATVSTPLIQLQGFATKDLGSLTFDVSNALHVVTNQTGYVVSRSFQCYDLQLTNGLNQITLHATDTVGHVGTTNINITLNYSGDTTAPLVNVLWPQNGTVVGSADFVVSASVNDTSATITALMNGTTNTVPVDRDGMVRVTGLPLNDGTNLLSMTAKDAAGNSFTTNLTLVKSPVTVSVNGLADDQLGQPLVQVTGTVSDPSSHASINGVSASVNAFGEWTANNVPVNPGQTSDLDVQITDSNNIPVAESSSRQSQKPFVTLAEYHQFSGDNNGIGDGQDAKVDWDYAAGGAWSTFSYSSWGNQGNDPAIAPDGPGYTAPVVADDDGQLFTPVWQNANVQLTHGNYYYSRINSKVMIVPGRSGQPGQQTAYRVMVRARSFNPIIGTDDSFYLPRLNGGSQGNVPIAPTSLKVNDQPVFDSGISDDNGAWGETTISAPAGALVPLTITATGSDDYTFEVKVTEQSFIESRGRMIHGVISGVSADDISLTVGDLTTGQPIGEYHGLFTNLNAESTGTMPNCQIYGKETNILSEAEVDAIENLSYSYGDQKVIFVRDANDPTKLHYYYIADGYDNLQISTSERTGQNTKTLNQTYQLTRSDFDQVITYLDNRIDSSATNDVPLTLAPIKQRSLLTKVAMEYFASTVNPSFSLVRGSVDGFMGGAHSDFEGITGVWTLLTSSAQRASTFKALTTWKTYAQIPDAIETGADNFMTAAETNGVTFHFGQSDFADAVSVRFFVGGYAAGFTTEQLCVAAVGVGVATKAGTAARTVLSMTKAGQRVVATTDAALVVVQRVKTATVDFAINSASKAARTTGLPQAATRMADAVVKLPYDSTRTVGQVINSYVDRLDIIQEELAKIGKPLDDFGVKAQRQLAKLLDRDLGFAPSEEALRGDIEFYDSVVNGSSDRYDDFITLLTKSDGTLDKHTLQATVELYEDAPVAGAGGNWEAIGEAADPSIAAQLTPNACGCATAQTLLADRGVTVFQSNIAGRMGEVLATDDGIVSALNHFDASSSWTSGFIELGDEPELILPIYQSHGSFGCIFHEFGAKIDHMVICDGTDEAGLVIIRDPFGGVSYKMTMENFQSVFTGRIIYKGS